MIGIAGGLVEPRAEGRDLDDLPAHAHVREPEPAPDQAAASEQLAHGVGRRGGRDVEVLRLQAQQEIAHTSTDEVGAMTRVGQRLQNPEGAPTDIGFGDAVLRLGDDGRLSDCSCDPCGFLADFWRISVRISGLSDPGRDV